MNRKKRCVWTIISTLLTVGVVALICITCFALHPQEQEQIEVDTYESVDANIRLQLRKYFILNDDGSLQVGFKNDENNPYSLIMTLGNSETRKAVYKTEPLVPNSELNTIPATALKDIDVSRVDKVSITLYKDGTEYGTAFNFDVVVIPKSVADEIIAYQEQNNIKQPVEMSA